MVQRMTRFIKVARMIAAKARRQGFNATINQRKDRMYVISVTRR